MPFDTNGMMECLARPEAFPHPVHNLEVIETHISYVILTGEFAYKIRKDVTLGFLDFSTLALRRQDCEEELRLNQRLAPDIYLEVVAITGTVQNPKVNGTGDAIEYAVKMRQFDPAQCLDHLVAKTSLAPRYFAELAHAIARFHARASKASPESDYGIEAGIWHYTQQNFQQIRECIADAGIRSRLATLENRCKSLHQQLGDEFIQRRREGWIRECHGDLHLGNLVMIEDTITPFDCLEFAPELRWIDTISELAFLYMDLIARHQPVLAQTVLNHYLSYSGDYMGLSLLPYYLAYRAMVRAKVAAIKYSQHPDQSTDERREVDRYLDLCETFLDQNRAPQIILMHGVSGSGKTWLAEQLATHSNAIHVRSDVERKRLLGLKPDEATDQNVQGAYSAQLSHLTYQRLMALSYAITDARFTVIVDATFLKRDNRFAYERLANVAGINLHILSLTAPESLLKTRIQQRLKESRDASEATIGVLTQQLAGELALTEKETASAIAVDTSQEIEIPNLVNQLGLGGWSS